MAKAAKQEHHSHKSEKKSEEKSAETPKTKAKLQHNPSFQEKKTSSHDQKPSAQDANYNFKTDEPRLQKQWIKQGIYKFDPKDISEKYFL